MANSSGMVVSVRIPKADLRKLQLLAEVYDQSVGSLIRTAVKKHVEELVRTDDFRSKAVNIQKRFDGILGQLLGTRKLPE